MTQTYTYHFDEQRSKGAVNCNMSTYDRLKSEYLPSLKPIFDAEGFKAKGDRALRVRLGGRIGIVTRPQYHLNHDRGGPEIQR